MGTIRVPYLIKVKGSFYWAPGKALRAAGWRSVALGKAEDAAVVAAQALNRQTRERRAGQPKAKPGSIAAMFDSYLESTRYLERAEETRRDYRKCLARLRRVKVNGRNVEEYRPADMRPKHADLILAVLQKKGPTFAARICRVARAVWEWGIRQDLAEVNPWTKMNLAAPAEREATWTRRQLAAFLIECRRENRESLGVAALIAYYGAQRPTDLRAVTWGALDGDTLTIRQQKTDAIAIIPVGAYPALRTALARARRRLGARPLPSAPIVRCEPTGARWAETTFQHEARRLMTRAGMGLEVQFRDLRATATTELMDAGVDTVLAQTHTGHVTVEMVRRYARRRLAQAEKAAATRQAEGVAARTKRVEKSKLARRGV